MKNLQAWQDPDTMYLIFGSVWKYAKSDYLDFLQFLKYLPKDGKILEYGCGIAPITQGFVRYLQHKDYHFVIADIMQINFIYAMYLLNKYEEVTSQLLAPWHNTLTDTETYDAIFCLTVMEHIPNPVEVMQSFHRALKDGGVLVFDYIKSEGEGLDSKTSLKQRAACIEYIRDNFEVIKGNLSSHESIGETVVRKR